MRFYSYSIYEIPEEDKKLSPINPYAHGNVSSESILGAIDTVCYRHHIEKVESYVLFQTYKHSIGRCVKVSIMIYEVAT